VPEHSKSKSASAALARNYPELYGRLPGGSLQAATHPDGGQRAVTRSVDYGLGG
jgi:hypothetical protein